jgi:RNA 3'-terminal phosphate cyclase (ATP)
VPATDSILVIDGAHGEGGGQILRTTLSLATLLGRRVRIEGIRRNRRNPGLAAQHLTAVRAAATLCNADVHGDELGSTRLEFIPACRPRAGAWRFDVGAAREGGSAGAATLVLQTVLLPLTAAVADSEVTVIGGTHMNWSPPYDYAAEVWLPLLRRIGIQAELEMKASGWYPVGKGEIRARISGRGGTVGAGLRPFDAVRRGRLLGVRGRALAANLPAHIPERMAAQVQRRLIELGVPLQLDAEVVSAACPGAGLCLLGEYENARAGFSALGRRGKPAEQVADEAVDLFLHHYHTNAALDLHLGDQALLPLALAPGPSRFSTETVTRHLQTNAWVIEQFGLARTVWRQENGIGLVEVAPLAGEVPAHA